MKGNHNPTWPKQRGGILLYSRIESLIRNKILSGSYEPGELLPRENDFADYYGVSKITIRKALEKLETENLIRRIPGKGTFVADEIPIRKQLIVSGSIYDIVRDAARYGVKVLGMEEKRIGETRYPKEVRSLLGLQNDDSITVISRVRELEGTPIFFLENFIPTDIASHITEDELTKEPLLEILKRKINLSLGRGEMFLEATPSDPDVAEILGVQMFDPLIVGKSYMWFPSGKPFEMVCLFMKSDYFRYQVKVEELSF